MNAFYLWDAFNIPAQHVIELILSVEFQRGCPVLGGAAEATHRLKAAGYEVWLVTARPLEMHPMTLEWLTAGGFAYDNLVMGLHRSAKTSAFPAAPRLPAKIAPMPPPPSPITPMWCTCSASPGTAIWSFPPMCAKSRRGMRWR